MTYGTLVLLFVLACLVVAAMFAIARIIKEKQQGEQLEADMAAKEAEIGDYSQFTEVDGYTGFVDENNQIWQMIQKNRLLRQLGRTKDKEKYENIFNAAKNPWGMTPSVFRSIRAGGVIGGMLLGLLLSFLFAKTMFIWFGVLIAFIAWFYPMYYYKAIAKEREQEWDKIYEFIWLFKHTSQLYDARKVCVECKNYIQKNYPQYQEIIDGLQDFYDYWDPEQIPEYIMQYYNFPIPKELYSILYQMEQTGVSPESNFSNLRVFCLNKHEKKIQKALSNVPAKATITTLPFLMASIILGLMLPMLVTFFTALGGGV